MKKFVFTLQAVLNVKRAVEKQLMGELAECNARIRSFEELRRELIVRESEQHEEYRRQLSEGLSPAEMQIWGFSNRAARERVEYQDKVLEQAEGERARIEKRLVAAMQERKILEKLREKQWEEYRVEEQREAAAAVAEFVGHEIFTNQEELGYGNGG